MNVSTCRLLAKSPWKAGLHLPAKSSQQTGVVLPAKSSQPKGGGLLANSSQLHLLANSSQQAGVVLLTKILSKQHHLCHNPLHYVFILRGLILLHIPQSVGMWQLQLSVATQQLLMAWQLHKAARLAWSPCNGLPGLAVVQVILEYEMQSNGCIK
ncbi:hypothetical protein PCANC_12045 [Puccinia coronata f. sp. avenae]|uniref:Uncharacterized protein n=1 Tax=Puccinia coronata f. sp. avenae TaxID=200324 RepID=A0A2N5T3J6_9BASI|nr:hypothetical protein PCASD_20125 [Puccinia coronata f. sp. avenae]PLW20062.1 hypothetical protein PCANC_12045 [Puccinia coronata f. sp. avenae]